MSNEQDCQIPKQARSAISLHEIITNVNIAKSDVEWWAHHRINLLEQTLKTVLLNLGISMHHQDCECPLCDAHRILQQKEKT